MAWERLFRDFDAARRSWEEQQMKAIVKKAHGQLQTATSDDWVTLRNALLDNERKWLVAAMFSKGDLPKGLFHEFISAAIYETNPSWNRVFVEPCIATHGHRKVNETLLSYVESGTDDEKAGAVNALYWAGMSLTYAAGAKAYTIENATPESRNAYLALSDIWQRRRCLFLREFVTNENLDVRRSLIPSLNLKASDYPDDFKPLVARAIEIARAHSDDYIRHRVEVQLGNEKLLKPLPHRDTSD